MRGAGADVRGMGADLHVSLRAGLCVNLGADLHTDLGADLGVSPGADLRVNWALTCARPSLSPV